MSVGLIAYGLGNLRSVVNALRAVGADARLVESPDALAACERLVLPGVGAFGDGMRRLEEGGWIEPLERAVREQGRPLLGICLGMQLLAEQGTEGGERPGLGWLPGRVEPMRSDDPAVRIPHIGWNDVRIAPGSRLFAGLEDGVSFYFVHSYALRGADGDAAGWTRHGDEFPAAVERGPIWAAQFHPEKSQQAGLQVLRNFVEAPF